MIEASVSSLTPCKISVVGLCVGTAEAADYGVNKSARIARAELSTQAITAIIDAQLVIGSERQLELIEFVMATGETQTETINLPKLNELGSLLNEHSDKRVVLLASGDPLFYGIGRWLGLHFASERLRFFPAVSSIQLACSRVGLSLQDVRVISLHGRPVESIRTCLRDKEKLLVLTDQHSHPARLARECVDAGLCLSTLTVFERLGYPDERIQQFKATEFSVSDTPASPVSDPSNPCFEFDSLNVVLIQSAGAACNSARYLPVFPGIPDHHFVTGAAPGKGMITKREARLAILSYLSPATDDVIWDVGAGCGGVAVELAYWSSKATVYAIEHNSHRLIHLYENRRKFGVVRNLNVLEGRAPECLSTLPMANKVFIGGSDGELESLLKLTWQKLPEGGLLVASAVTQSSRSTLASFAAALMACQVESVVLSVKRGALIDEGFQYTEKLPVEIFCFVKSSILNIAQR